MQQATLARLETGGRAEPRFTTIAAIAEALGTSLDVLAVEAGLMTTLPKPSELRQKVREAIRAAREARQVIAAADASLSQIVQLGEAPRSRR
jgi:transcriptional regulator with XRE-family HTH domain